MATYKLSGATATGSWSLLSNMLDISWKRHVLRVLALVALALILGLYSGHLFQTLFLTLALYCGWLLYNMVQLSRWLEGEPSDPPDSYGIWSEIFDKIHLLQRRNQKQHATNESIIMEFRNMTDALPDATLVLDEQDSIIWFNEAARSLLGLQSPDDLGQAVTNLLREPDFADWIAVQEQLESRFEMTSPMDSYSRLSMTAVRLRKNQRLLILRDITDIHNLEQIRRDFVANVSHELRTPLTVLFGYLEALRDNADEQTAPALERMQEQASQMKDLLSDLLELSRLQAASETESPEDTPVDVCTMIQELRDQAEEISQGDRDIEVHCESNNQLMGKRKDLESAFRNLINNAIYYTPDGGHIDITWNVTDEGQIFSVKDSGIGIPSKDIPRLTERFYRVGSDRSRHTGGTGLGLSIVKHVLNAHGAHLVIDSELGEGSCFSCVFPAERQLKPDTTSPDSAS